MSVPAGIFDSLVKLTKIVSKNNHKNAFVYLISSIGELKTRLEEIRRRLKERDDELLTNAVKALNYDDRERASIYAAEIVEVRKLVKIVNIALLAIERLLERLRTMDIVNDMKMPMSLALGILNEIRQMFATTMPELASAVDTIVSNVNTLVSSTQTPESSVNIVTKTREVEEIIKEAEIRAEENMKTSLQSLPVQLKSMIDTVNNDVAKHIQNIQREEVFANNRSFIAATVPTSYMKLSNLDVALYQAIMKSAGVIDINEYAKRFGVSKEEILNSLKRLEQLGWVKIT